MVHFASLFWGIVRICIGIPSSDYRLMGIFGRLVVDVHERCTWKQLIIPLELEDCVSGWSLHFNGQSWLAVNDTLLYGYWQLAFVPGLQIFCMTFDPHKKYRVECLVNSSCE